MSPEIKDKLIKELNEQIDNNTFYSLNKEIGVVDNFSTFDSSENIGKTAFSRLAKIENTDIVENTQKYSNIMERYDTDMFKGVGLYRPLVSSDFNPLQKNVYNYSNTYETMVHRIGFEGKNGGIIENLSNNLYSTVENNKTSQKEIVLTPYFNNETEIKPIAPNTFKIADIIKNSTEGEVINFRQIPTELSLTKTSNFKTFWARSIQTFKNIFQKR